MSDGPSAFATGRSCRMLRNAKVTMRDGARLSTSIYLPLSEGPYPVVLVRTAYNRNWGPDQFLAEHGMAFVIQDCRGRYDSEGHHYPFISEPNDGFDTLEWIGQQPWCNGKIGMWGDSYLAGAQFYAAPMGSRYLCALNPRFMANDCWKHAYYCDGAFSLALTWSWLCFECASRTSEANLMPAFDVPKLLRHLPLLTLDEASGAGPVRAYRDYVSHTRYGDYWRFLRTLDDFHRYTVPILLTGGWYDNYPGEATTAFMTLRAVAPTPELRDAHRLLIGPWTHGINWTTKLGELDFGPAALTENDATHRWLDCLLHGGQSKEFQAAPVRLFVMGTNVWRDEYEWPLARTRYTDYYLHADGALNPAAPGAEPPDRYTYDPENPVPTTGGNHSVGTYNPGLYEFCKPGPYDQRPVEQRPDVRSYTSPVLDADLEVTGPVVLKLYAASSARDTDFVAKLCDVYPDGRSMNITEGVIRARFREDVWGAPKLLVPGQVYEFTVDLLVTSNVFLRGHRLRLDLMSSNFPLWDRNLNTGNDPATDTAMQRAEQTICHDQAHPSHLILPVIPGPRT